MPDAHEVFKTLSCYEKTLVLHARRLPNEITRDVPEIDKWRESVYSYIKEVIQ
jgi:hypothetical protein